MSVLLIAAFIILALALRRLLFPPSSSSTPKPKGPAKTLAHKKLLEEAFDHAPFTLDDNDQPLSCDTPLPPRVLILYATEYGFALTVAKSIAESLSGDPELYPRIVNMLHYEVIDFSKETHVVVVCSTTGDGVPPNEAAAFHTALNNSQIHFSSHCKYSVIALGDRSYPHFCRAGALFDRAFALNFQRGDSGTSLVSLEDEESEVECSSRLLARVEVDQEDWDVINDYIEKLSGAITQDIQDDQKEDDEELDYLPLTIQKYAKTLSEGSSQYTRHNPFPAVVAAKRLLTAPCTQPDHKQVARIEIDISNSGLSYQSGDAVGIMPSNNPAQVSRILRALAASGEENVTLPEELKIPEGASKMTDFEHALTDLLDLRAIKPYLISTLARHATSASEVDIAVKILGADPRDPKVAANAAKNSHMSEFGKGYVKNRDVLDVLHAFPSASLSPQQVIDCLRPLHARYYSISSTPLKSPDNIAITVDVIRYSSHGTEKQGVASTFLLDRCAVNQTKVPIFITPNPNFKLPDNPALPIIMIGPGTGIAPFIGFIEQRVHTKATGENIMFFGCRFERQDYVYKSELTKWSETGQIKLYSAFSRDDVDKVYVQHLMGRCRNKLWEVINEEGGHVYVCGDGGKMAEDVDKELRGICGECGGLDSKQVDDYMNKLSKEKRYQRDVWVS